MRLKLHSFGLKWRKTHAREGQTCTPIRGQLRTPIDTPGGGINIRGAAQAEGGQPDPKPARQPALLPVLAVSICRCRRSLPPRAECVSEDALAGGLSPARGWRSGCCRRPPGYRASAIAHCARVSVTLPAAGYDYDMDWTPYVGGTFTRWNGTARPSLSLW